MKGDENSHFFHGLIKGRLKRNIINGINVNGVWVENRSKVKEEIFNHLSNHFREPEEKRPGFRSTRFKQLADQQVAALQAPVTEVELKNAVWNCAEDKAPG